jgi:hypothetical protein
MQLLKLPRGHHLHGFRGHHPQFGSSSARIPYDVPGIYDTAKPHPEVDCQSKTKKPSLNPRSPHVISKPSACSASAGDDDEIAPERAFMAHRKKPSDASTNVSRERMGLPRDNDRGRIQASPKSKIGNRKSRPRGRVVILSARNGQGDSRDPDPVSEVAVVRSVLIAQAPHPKPLSTNRLQNALHERGIKLRCDDYSGATP